MDNICVQQAWSKDVILQTLENASTPIHQVHVVAHASAALLSLACRYNNNSRLRALAIACNEASFDDHNRAIHALQHEDNLVTGFFANALEKHRLEKFGAIMPAMPVGKYGVAMPAIVSASLLISAILTLILI